MPRPHPALHSPCPPSLACGHALCLDGHSYELTGGVGVTEGRYHFIAPCGLLHCGNKDTPPQNTWGGGSGIRAWGPHAPPGVRPGLLWSLDSQQPSPGRSHFRWWVRPSRAEGQETD